MKKKHPGKPEPSRRTSIVFHNLLRTANLKLPSTLTLVEWDETLGYFCNRCAYCGTLDWTTMDHFIPVSAGGGTTRDNCVPACLECNQKKNYLEQDGAAPDALNPSRIADVRRYLRERKTS